MSFFDCLGVFDSVRPPHKYKQLFLFILSWSLFSRSIHCLWCYEQTSKSPWWWSHLPPSPLPWPPSIMSTVLCLRSSNSQQNHIANTFFCVCFNYWPARFDSQHHGSASTNKLTSGPRIFRFIQTAWSMWSVLDAPMTVSLQCQCL